MEVDGLRFKYVIQIIQTGAWGSLMALNLIDAEAGTRRIGDCPVALGRGSRSTTLDEIHAQKAMMSSAGMLLSEFKRTNSANRTLSRVLTPRRPDSGGPMRLAERCTERARATTSHKPRRHSNQSTLPTRRRSPRVPCVHHTLAAWTFAHRTIQRALEHGLQEPGHRSTLWHPACCKSRQQRSRPVRGLQHQSCPATGGSGLPICLNGETI
jgi:hypothetical protein